MRPSTVAFHALWDAHPVHPQVDRNTDERYKFVFRPADGLVTFSAIDPASASLGDCPAQPEVTFESKMTDEPQETLYAAIGMEVNGVFFH